MPMAAFIQVGVLILFAVYSYAKDYLSNPEGSQYLPPVRAEFAPTEDPKGSRPDLMAFQIACSVPICVSGLYGVYSYLTLPSLSSTSPTTRLFGHHRPSEFVAAVNFMFQFFDLLVSFLIEEHRTAVMITHHILACTVSYWCLRHRMLHYYAPFFLGVTEFSSVPLVIVDTEKYFDLSAFPKASAVSELSKPAFAVLFLSIRVYFWFVVVTPTLLTDIRYALSSKAGPSVCESHRPGLSYVLYGFGFMNAALGALQLFWAGIVVKAILDAVNDGSEL